MHVALKVTSRLIALTLFIAPLAGAAHFGFAPLVAHHRKNEAEIFSEREQLGRFVSIASIEDQIDNLIEQAMSAAPSEQFVDGDSRPIILAKLQNRLKAIARSHQVTISSTRAANGKSIEGLPFHGVQLNLFGRANAVNAFIRAVETSLPFYFVEKVHVRAGNWNTGNRAQQSRLDAQMEIYAAAARTLNELSLAESQVRK